MFNEVAKSLCCTYEVQSLGNIYNDCTHEVQSLGNMYNNVWRDFFHYV